MRESLNQITTRFIENMNLSKKNYKFELDITRGLISFIYTKEDRSLDYLKISNSKDVIKKNTSVFSSLRTESILIPSTKLSLKDNPKDEVLKAKKIMSIFKESFKFSGAGANISYFLAENTEKIDTTKAIKRGRLVYDIHKKNHPFITSDEDILLAILLGIYKEDIRQAVLDSEYYYEKLKKPIKYSNDVQRISNILALFDLNKNLIIEKIIRLNEDLKLEKYRLKERTLFVLPLLVILEDDVTKIKEDIIEVYKKLDDGGIIGVFKMEKSYGLMFAGVLVILDYIKNNKGYNNIEEIIIGELNNIENIIQDIIMMNTIIIANSIIISSSVD